MIVGVDISEHNGSIDWQTLKNNTNFVIIRSSYGNGYIDKWLGNNRTQARNLGLLRGFYHYAYPEYNTPEAEAEWFCKVMNGDPLQEGEVLFLDMEEQFSGNKVDWSKRFLDYVSVKLGCKPLFYSYQSYMDNNNWQSLVDAGYGLWLASYTYDPNKNTGNTHEWPFMAFQQWTDVESVPGISGNVDGDAFFGDSKAFGQYGYHKPVEVVTPPVEVPITVTTTSQPVVSTGTTGTSSANSTTTIDIPITTSQTTISQPPKKSSHPLGWLIALLKFLWTGKRG